MRLPKDLYDEIKAHAVFEAPRECVGIVATHDGQPVKVFRGINVAEDPMRGFRMGTRDQMAILKEIRSRGRGWAVGAVYHSHPLGGPFPSQRDRKMAEPDVVQLIVGMGAGLETRAWRLSAVRANPEPLEVY